MLTRGGAYDGWDGVVVLLCVVEELQDIISSDDSGLAGENVLAAHDCGCGMYSFMCGFWGIFIVKSSVDLRGYYVYEVVV